MTFGDGGASKSKPHARVLLATPWPVIRLEQSQCSDCPTLNLNYVTGEHRGQLPVSRRQRFKAPLERKTGRPERRNGFDVVVVIFHIMKSDKSPLSSAAIPSHLSNELNAPFLFCLPHALASRLS